VAAADGLERWRDEDFCYLTTTGRRTGKAHRIEIWFAVRDTRLYVLSGGRDHSDWVRNLRLDPRVMVELGDNRRSGTARVLEDGTPEDQLARTLLVQKYAGPKEGDLENWGRTSLAVAVDISAMT
jgi:deazaflavin-dependent oxidoreductase (nitroreductase family)